MDFVDQNPLVGVSQSPPLPLMQPLQPVAAFKSGKSGLSAEEVLSFVTHLLLIPVILSTCASASIFKFAVMQGLQVAWRLT